MKCIIVLNLYVADLKIRVWFLIVLSNFIIVLMHCFVGIVALKCYVFNHAKMKLEIIFSVVTNLLL
jgi:hypothetical protein